MLRNKFKYVLFEIGDEKNQTFESERLGELILPNPISSGDVINSHINGTYKVVEIWHSETVSMVYGRKID
jgi:hypothetical protein